MGALKVGVLDVYSPPLYSPGRSWELAVPSQMYGAVPGAQFMRRLCLSLSYPFQYGRFSLTQRVGVTQLFSGLLSKGTAPYVAVHSVHPWEDGNSGAFYVTI